jgi:hypothetical protein
MRLKVAVGQPLRRVLISGIAPNEIEISHGRVSWQDCWRSLDQGPLASSIGWTHPLKPNTTGAVLE